jgi:hypothetical protein
MSDRHASPHARRALVDHGMQTSQTLRHFLEKEKMTTAAIPVDSGPVLGWPWRKPRMPGEHLSKSGGKYEGRYTPP